MFEPISESQITSAIVSEFAEDLKKYARTDVIIIGGGPSGLMAAKELASKKIKVKDLDILDGTPVIDIKPYWPIYDKVEDGIIPEWVNKLDL